MATFMYASKKSYVLDFSCGLSSLNCSDFIGMIYLVFNDITLFKSLLPCYNVNIAEYWFLYREGFIF